MQTTNLALNKQITKDLNAEGIYGQLTTNEADGTALVRKNPDAPIASTVTEVGRALTEAGYSIRSTSDRQGFVVQGNSEERGMAHARSIAEWLSGLTGTPVGEGMDEIRVLDADEADRILGHGGRRLAAVVYEGGPGGWTTVGHYPDWNGVTEAAARGDVEDHGTWAEANNSWSVSIYA